MFLLKITDRRNTRRVKLCQLTHLPGTPSGSSQVVSTTEARETIIHFPSVKEQNAFLRDGNDQWMVKVIVSQSQHWVTNHLVHSYGPDGWTVYAEVWPKGSESSKTVLSTRACTSLETACKEFWKLWNHDPKWPKDHSGQSVRLIRLNEPKQEEVF